MIGSRVIGRGGTVEPRVELNLAFPGFDVLVGLGLPGAWTGLLRGPGIRNGLFSGVIGMIMMDFCFKVVNTYFADRNSRG